MEFSGVIRPLLASDNTQEITKLFQRSMEGFEGYEDEFTSELKDNFDGRTGTNYFVAVISDKVVGLIGYVLETQDTYQIGWFAVENKLKRRGIGSALIAHIEKELANKARLLMAEVWDSTENEPARKFYIRNGYFPTATIPDYYDDEDGDMTFFIKRL